MSLTLGSAPLSAHPAHANYTIEGPKHRIFVEPCQKRVRLELGDEIVADSCRAVLLHETGLLPVYYFPREDLRLGSLTATEHKTRCPFKGEASYWSVRAGGKMLNNAAWAYLEPKAALQLLAGRMAFYLDRMDAIYEEDEKLLGHPHDPYHRVDTLRSSRHVRVRFGKEVVAETRQPRAVFETGLPVRWYIPRQDVRMERLLPSSKTTICPYKGVATYWSLRDGPQDMAWAYENPLPEGTGLAGHLSFSATGIEVEVAEPAGGVGAAP